MQSIELDDKSYSVGNNPIFAYDDGNAIWRRVACDASGHLIMVEASTSSQVVEPTVSGVVLDEGEGQVLNVVNATNSLVTLLDDQTPIGTVLPLSSITAPITYSTSLVVKSAAAALGATVSAVWRSLP